MADARMIAPQAKLLPDNRRLHLHHGPIDLIVEAFGSPDEINKAYLQAHDAFKTVLSQLVEELAFLRSANPAEFGELHGSVARRMVRAILPHSGIFVTPMAAVAGAVADHMLAAMIKDRELERAYVNNGGDCAWFLTSGETFKLGAVAQNGFGSVEVSYHDHVRGVATSGWRGRSHSFGIADAVTVLAMDTASADVAATLIANAVDLPDHPAVARQPASKSNPDSDLGGRLVTTEVGPLTDTDVKLALDRGQVAAMDMKSRGLIVDALLFLNGETRQLNKQRTLEDA